MKYSLALLAVIAAVEASPFPQAVTAAISPSAAAPSGCTGSYPSSFGIVNINVTAVGGTATTAAKVTQTADGQPGASGSTKVTGAVSQTSDGQPQAPTGMTVAPVSMISDGQIQGGTATQMMMPVTQISDGQVQGPTVVVMPASQISDGQPQFATTTAISQISDGQPQAATATKSAVTQISDGQPQGATATAASQKSDGQPQATSATASAAAAGTTSIAFCQSNSTLALTLNNGILKDSKGRTGYIASNYQFQFDSPPQAGAIYTAGFSVCGNGTLSLGASSIFYQCLSGNFYNIYDRPWAPQCSPIYIQTGKLVQCS